MELSKINQGLDPTKIRMKTRCVTIDSLLERIKNNEIDLASDFQRQSSIWTPEVKSRLIESILIRIPLPVFYIDATEDTWVVMDGLQRISTLKSFILDKSLTLTGLQFLVELENNKYDDLPRYHRRRIEETELTIHFVESGTPSEIKYQIFERIHTKGEDSEIKIT